MFHDGSLQSGIALAIQESKLVACFVRDDSATSKLWEEEWLQSGWLSTLLTQKAVLLRLEAGSTEAGFLAAFSDITHVPTFVVIHNGQLQVQLRSDATKEEFVNSIRSVLGADAIPGSSAVRIASTSTPPPPPPPVVSPETPEVEDDLHERSEPTATTAASALSANAQGKQKAVPAYDSKPGPSSKPASAAQQAARDALRKKKKEEAEELDRIKARIEADKVARRVQAEARKAERDQEQQSSTPLPSESQPHTIPSSKARSQAKNVKLSVRLFDGRTIRSSFPPTASLEKQVRNWIDTEFSQLAHDDANITQHKQLPPYYFRHILSPQPSRELSAGDESQHLTDIDLAPSATLVLVPVKGYTDAYAGASGGRGGGVVGAATGLVGGALGLLSSTVGLVGSTLGSVVGLGSSAAAGNGQTSGSLSSSAPASAPAPSPPTEASSIRVRTLADQRGPREQQQFYNGNQLSTEPRNEDVDKRD